MVLKRISPPLWSGHSGPSNQPTIAPLREAHAQAHRWKRAGARRDQRAIAHGSTELRIAAKPELPMMSVKVCEPATTLAPSWLCQVTSWSTGSAGLPHPSGSALVWRRPSCASGLHSSGCTSSLCPSDFFISSAPPQSSVAPAPSSGSTPLH